MAAGNPTADRDAADVAVVKMFFEERRRGRLRSLEAVRRQMRIVEEDDEQSPCRRG